MNTNTSITSANATRRPAGETASSDGEKSIGVPCAMSEIANYDQLGTLNKLLTDTRNALLSLDQPNVSEDESPEAGSVDTSAGTQAVEPGATANFGNDILANINAILIMCMQLSSQLQKSNRQNDLTQAMGAFKERMGAADDAVDAANKAFIGGITQACLSFLGGTLNLIGGVQAGKEPAGAGSETRQRMTMDKWSAGGSMSQSIGSMASAGANRAAADSKKAQDQAEALAGLLQSFGGNSSEMANSVASTISQMQNLLSQFAQAQKDATLGIIREI